MRLRGFTLAEENLIEGDRTMSFSKLAGCAAALVVLGAMLVQACFGDGDAVKEFKEEWAAAKNFPLNQKEAINKVSREMTVEAVKAITDVAFKEEVSYVAMQAAFEALSRMRTQEIVEWMSDEVCKNGEWRVRSVLAKVLGEYGDPFAVDGLLKALEDKKWEVRLAVAKALGEMPSSRKIVEALIEQVQKEQGRLVYEFGNVLEKLTGAGGLDEAEDWKNWWKAKKDSWAPPSGGSGYDSPETARPILDEPKTVADSPIYGRIKSKKVIFVVDTSGSMETEGDWGEGDSKKKMSRLDIVKEELCKVIDTQITEQHKFNIITFDKDVKAWKSKPVAGTTGARNNAKSYVNKLKPGGVTYTYGALKEAFDNEDIDTIYFLSDGEPTHPPNSEEVNRDWILGKIKAINLSKNRVIHTIAFMVGRGEDFGFEEDKSKCAAFMEALAKSTGGNFKKMD
jgi:hypothetical protein